MRDVSQPARGGIVLVLVRDVLGAGLMGALVEGEGATPAFPFASERADIAVRRVRPRIVLADGYHTAARSDAFHAAAVACESAVILFAPAEPWADLQAVVRERPGVRLVAPHDGQSLATLVQAALRGESDPGDESRT